MVSINDDIKNVGKNVAKKAAYGFATRGAGGAIRGATEATTSGTVNALAERSAKRFQKNKPEEKPDAKKKKLTGTIFYLILALAIFKDVFDAATDLTVVFSILSLVTTPIYTFVLAFYLFTEGIKPTARKLVSIAISTVLGLIPILNLLPVTTINLLLLRFFENNEKIQKLAGSKVAGKMSKIV